MSTVHGTRAAAARERIAQLADQGLDPRVFVHEVAARLRRVVPYVRAAWTVTDVETLLPTEWVLVEPDLDCDFNDKTARGELQGDDVNRFDDLERSGRHIATMRDATHGDPAASARYRDVLAPRGLHDEVRVLARSGDVTWGTVALARASDSAAFSTDESRYLASIAAHLGLRRGPLAASAGGAVGMLVIGSDRTLQMATDDARRWAGAPALALCQQGLSAAYDKISSPCRRRRPSDGASPLRPARARALIPGDGWLHIRAGVLASVTGEPPRIGVVLEPAPRHVLQPLLFALHGLTPRERVVAEPLGSGHSTEHIARLSSISRNTVRDDTKAIFAKTGVRSRPELTTALGSERS